MTTSLKCGIINPSRKVLKIYISYINIHAYGDATFYRQLSHCLHSDAAVPLPARVWRSCCFPKNSFHEELRLSFAERCTRMVNWFAWGDTWCGTHQRAVQHCGQKLSSWLFLSYHASEFACISPQIFTVARLAKPFSARQYKQGVCSVWLCLRFQT